MIEADFARFYPRDDLLDFYAGRMSARRLWVLLRGLPPEAATVVVSRRQASAGPEGAGDGQRPAERHLAPVRCLEDIPVAPSLAEVGSFVQSGGDEFTEKFGQTG